MSNAKSLKHFGYGLLAVTAVVALLFYKSFLPGWTLFANDGPLGVSVSEHGQFTQAWDGAWNDLNWLGMSSLAVLPQTTTLLWYLLGDSPVMYSKFQVPISLIFLGAAVLICLRQFRISYPACVVAAIAAALNMNSFSHAAWGLPSRCWAMGSALLAIAALRSGMNSRPFLKAVLAGWAVANGIMEAYDVGAIYSLYVAAFGVFAAFAYWKASALNIGKGVAVVAVVAITSAICAAAGLDILIGTQVKGVAGMEQDAASKEARWDGATMWSLPKAETLRVLIPGLFGYRMDAENGGNYWGSSGQSPGVPTSRHSGSGEYAGALVVAIAAFGIANAFRRKNGPFSDTERRVILFFAAAALISLLLSWGRHAPFYRAVYALPFFSTIRNPMKFMHPFHMVLVIIFGFGIEAILRSYVKEASTKVAGLKPTLSAWWSKAGAFEKKWTYSSLAFCGVFLLGAFVYMSSRRELLGYLRTGGFPPEMAEKIASFSYSETMIAWLITAAAVALVIVALSGWFSGRRAHWITWAFGLFVAADLIHANLPWLNYYNYKERYESNAVIDFLKRESYEHRTTARVTPFGQAHFVQQNTGFFMGVANQWLQNHFQYYNIQALEPVQMPRTPEIDEQYIKALFPGATNQQTVIPRMWELTNTRYLVGDRNYIMSLAQTLEPAQQRFRPVLNFDMTPKPGVQMERATIDDLTWVENPNGRFAVVEFTGALPRAKLYSAWQTVTNDAAALKELVSPSFNAQTNLLIQASIPIAPSEGTNFQGTARITSYHPKRIELSVSNNAPAVLLYNDKLDSGWYLEIDGKPSEFVRANFIMRGIPLVPGEHKVTMRYHTSTKGLYISLAGIGAALLAACLIGFLPSRRKDPATA